MRVDVTQEDIERGERGSPSSCPIALAIRRALGWKGHVGLIYISYSRAYIDDGAAIMPSEAGNFVEDYDSGDFVVPFSFDLEEQ